MKEIMILGEGCNFLKANSRGCVGLMVENNVFLGGGGECTSNKGELKQLKLYTNREEWPRKDWSIKVKKINIDK